MTTSCPSVFSAACLRNHFIIYWKHRNNPSIAKQLDTVMKTMNKEECNNFVIPLPSWVALFLLYLFLVLQHILVKDGRKDMIIFNTAKGPTMASILVNLKTPTKDWMELDCNFGIVMTIFLIHLWIDGSPSQIETLPCTQTVLGYVSNNSSTTPTSQAHSLLSLTQFSSCNVASYLVWTSVQQIGNQYDVLQETCNSAFSWWLIEGKV